MPELPEVEIITRRLREGTKATRLHGKIITKVSIHWPRHIIQPSVPTFRKRIQGRVITDVHRRGKYIVMPLELGTLLFHLGMSGDLYLRPAETPRGQHEHSIFHLSDGWQLRFTDTRKFGKIYYLTDPDLILNQLGPEPLDPQFTTEALALKLAGKRRMIKPLLLDQRFLAGLGNIYTDELLHIAKIHPRTRSDQLTIHQIQDLWHGIRSALQAGLRHNGASIDWVYRGGNYQNHFRVYQRTGEPCPDCATQIQRIVVGQRGTHICPTCQPEIIE